MARSGSKVGGDVLASSASAVTNCLFCDQPAVAWCDCAIGFGIVGYIRVGLLSENKWHAVRGTEPDGSITMFTCDAPMCQEHRKHVGLLHGDFHTMDAETIDWCPLHKEREAPPMTGEEADKLRRKLHSVAMRRRMRTPTPKPPMVAT